MRAKLPYCTEGSEWVSVSSNSARQANRLETREELILPFPCEGSEASSLKLPSQLNALFLRTSVSIVLRPPEGLMRSTLLWEIIYFTQSLLI